jgi:hypothetical protein
MSQELDFAQIERQLFTRVMGCYFGWSRHRRRCASAIPAFLGRVRAPLCWGEGEPSQSVVRPVHERCLKRRQSEP